MMLSTSAASIVPNNKLYHLLKSILETYPIIANKANNIADIPNNIIIEFNSKYAKSVDKVTPFSSE